MRCIAAGIGRRLAHDLNQPIRRYEPFDISASERIAAVLVDGNSRVSTAISTSSSQPGRMRHCTSVISRVAVTLLMPDRNWSGRIWMKA